MNKTHNYPIGSVSYGTMRSQDLFEAFTSELQDLNPKRYEAFVREHAEAFAIEDYDDMTDDQEEALECAVDELFGILNEFAGPYFYFGERPGDVVDYGFWFDSESFNDAVWSGEVLRVNDLSEITDPEEHEYIAVISDHGNITLYDLNGQEVWEIV